MHWVKKHMPLFTQAKPNSFEYNDVNTSISNQFYSWGNLNPLRVLLFFWYNRSLGTAQRRAVLTNTPTPTREVTKSDTDGLKNIEFVWDSVIWLFWNGFACNFKKIFIIQILFIWNELYLIICNIKQDSDEESFRKT